MPPLCCVQCSGPSFTSSKAKERRGRCSCSPQRLSALTVLPLPAWSQEMLSKTFSPRLLALAQLLFPQGMLPGNARGSATSSCQTAASRAASSPGPEASQSAQGCSCQHRVQADTRRAGRGSSGCHHPAPAPAPGAGPFSCPTVGRARRGWRGLHTVSTQECALGMLKP